MSQKKLQSSVVQNDTVIDISNNPIGNIKDIIKNTDNSNDIDNEKRKRYIPFWTEDPNILFNQKYIFEFFPVDTMTYEQKLNTVSRTVIILTIIGFIITKNISTLLVGAVTLGAIYLLYFYHIKEIDKKESKKIVDELKEGFENPAITFLKNNNLQTDPGIFAESTPNNPFSNVLMTDYDFNPHKKPAPPAFNSVINNNILSNAKQLVRDINPDQPDIADKLFKDLGEELVFEQSMRQFVSNPSTTIPNDSTSFAEFCYGSMISAKEGNLFSAAKNLPRYNLY